MAHGRQSPEVHAPDPTEAAAGGASPLQQVLDNTSAAVFAKDRGGRYLFCNREFEHLTGRSADDLLGRTDRDIFPSELAASLRRNDMQVLMGGRAMEFEETGLFGGMQRTYLSSKFPLFDEDGEPYAVCGIATDITRRKQVEAALSSSALAVSSAHGVPLFAELARYLTGILDVEFALISELREGDPVSMHVLAFIANGELSERFEYPLAGTACQTVVGHGFRFYPASLPALFPLDSDLVELGAESYAGYPLVDAAGRPLGVIAILSSRPLEQPEFIESVMRIFAVRASAELERLRADQALLASQASYRQIFEASEDAIFVHDIDTGAIVDVNPKACQTYGHSYEDMLQMGVDRLGSGVPPYTPEDAHRHLQRAKELGATGFEWHRRNRDGSLRWDEVYLKVASIGGVQRILAFTRDITERREAESRRNQLELQLLQAKKMEALGHLTGGIAHDFNNLLASIMGYVVLASERAGNGDERLASYLDRTLQSCERARELIQQMLMFSRGHKGAPRPVEPRGRVEQGLEALRATLPPGIGVRLQSAPDVPPVVVDPVQLDQVLMNLFVNACDAMQDDGRLDVALSRHADARGVCSACKQPFEGDFVAFEVRDSGPGIPADALERLFEPFFSTKPPGKGTGMGLATVHGIVHEHHGHLQVQTAAGEGTCFRVLLPARHDAQPAAGEDADAATRAPAPRLSGRALVVDDERLVGEFMCELLATWGMQARAALDPREALALVAGAPSAFDVVITDQAMPAMTGLSLAAGLRRAAPALPVILYSGRHDQLDAAEARRAGVRHILAKPVDARELEAALRGCLGQ